MTLIEGIGDEVILFLAIALLVIILTIIWLFPFQQTQLSLNVTNLSQPNEVSHSHSDNLEYNTAIVNDHLNTDLSCDNTDSSQVLRLRDADSNCNSDVDRTEVVMNSENDLSSTSSIDQNRAQSSHLINDPDFLRKRRLEFFDQQSIVDNIGASNSPIDNITNDYRQTLPSHANESNVDSNDNETNDAILRDGMIQIRLKYLNDTERTIQCKINDRIGEFKRTHFSEDITNNKIVRLIYNGQLLRTEDRTLESYGVIHNCVIHVQISQNQPMQGSSTIHSDSDLDLSHLMWPLFGIILGIIWMLHFQYREYFNVTSTVALVGITGLFFIVLWNQSSLNSSHTSRMENTQYTSSQQQ